MSRNRSVTEAEIIAAANVIAAQGEMPTIVAVRGYLNTTSSESTILKYLNAWKINLLKYALLIESSEFDHEDFLQAKHANQVLQQNISQLSEQLASASSELLDLEKTKLKLEQSNTQLAANLQLAEQQNSNLQNKCVHLQELYSNLLQERNSALETVSNEKNQLIESLRDELRHVNAAGLDKIRTTSTQGHDALLQEKIKNIALQDKISLIKKDLQRIMLLDVSTCE
jgi:hypothetical protein